MKGFIALLVTYWLIMAVGQFLGIKPSLLESVLVIVATLTATGVKDIINDRY